jgi:hypothetical protein
MNADDLIKEISNARKAFALEIGLGPDDQAAMNFKIREERGQDRDAPRPEKMVAENPLFFRPREMMGVADPVAERVRAEMGAGRVKGIGGNIGHIGGAIGGDLIQDRARAVWWLLNAPQAAGNVMNEVAVGMANKDLFRQEPLHIDFNDLRKMEKAGHAERDQDGKIRPKPLVVAGPNGKAFRKNHASGMVRALGIPAGLAINQGIGLMTPFGGYEGYEAVVPSAEDPSKTDNVLAEVGTKYILGRTGNLLDYDEFKKVRPDVSKGEYNAYKAFKYDKNPDYDLSDGDFTTHSRILKGTTDGIHGPEIQFLGRSLPLNTAIIPFLSSVAGTVAGVRPSAKARREGRFDEHAVKRGIAGGFGGYAAGTIAGNLLESERRRRNEAENEAYYDKLDKLEGT